MRIAVIAPSLVVGGAERSLIKFLQAVSPEVDRIRLISFSAPGADVAEPLPENVELATLGGRASSSPILWVRVGRLLRVMEPDVIVGWSTYANFVAALTARVVPKARLIVSERIYVPDMFGRNNVSPLRRTIVLGLMRVLYRHADVVTANSGRSVRFLRQYVGGPPHFRLLPNTVDIAALDARATEAIPILHEASGAPRLLAVGRLVHQKGFDVLLRALAIVRKDYPDWSLVMVGDGPERDSLRALASSIGVSDAVRWLGQVGNPFPYFRWANIVVVPSRFEGFPNVPLEAMSLGKAVICSDCRTGPRELTVNGRYGRLVPVGDAVALAREIVALGAAPVIRESLGASAREHVGRTYDMSAVRRQYADVLGMCT